MARLDRKVAVVTGGADGIGAAIVRAMTAEGATVVFGDIDDAKGRDLADALVQDGADARFRHCDVGEPDALRTLIETAASDGGRVDILVNNAAVAIGGMPLHEMTGEQWDRLIRINLSSVFWGCKFALPSMIRQQGGVIINMASAQGHIGLDGWTAYAGAKGAIMAMTRQMAVEFGPHNIRVNSISPGTIATPMNEKVVADLGESLRRAWVKMHPIGRIGLPEEVAEAAVYLASDAAGFTTGMDLRVDGGLTAAPRYVPDLV